MELTKQKQAILTEIAKITYIIRENILVFSLCPNCLSNYITTINMLTGIVLDKVTVKDFMDSLHESNNPDEYQYYVDFIHKHEIEY